MINNILIYSLISGAIYALIAIGFTIIYRTVRFFHLAHGAVYTVGAYVGYTVVSSWLVGVGGESNWVGITLAVILGVIAAGALGVLIDRVVYYPLRKQKASDLIFLLASFGVFIFIQNTIQLIYGAQILTIRTGPIKEGNHVLGAVITDVQIVLLVVSCLLLVMMWWFSQKTKLGKAMRAVADDPMAANIVGINPEQITMYAFALGSMLAGIAGILISFETNLEPTMGFNAVLKGVIASIIGGIGSIPGAVLGAFFLGLAENFGIWYISAGWKDAIAFGILIAFLLIRPWGILGKKNQKEQL